MSVDFQASLFGSVECAEAAGGVSEQIFADLSGLRRVRLDARSWVDVLPGWLRGADDLFAHLVQVVPWRAERREMYDRMVEVPRLVYTYGVGQPLPDPVLDQARGALDAHYADELGERFVTAGCCFYRDGKDSVAWHGDNLGRGRRQDTMVAILGLGEARKLQFRPRGGTLAHEFAVGHGDLVVMGGACQREWEHAVPKTARPVGPRISVQFRPRNVF